MLSHCGFDVQFSNDFLLSMNSNLSIFSFRLVFLFSVPHLRNLSSSEGHKNILLFFK